MSTRQRFLLRRTFRPGHHIGAHADADPSARDSGMVNDYLRDAMRTGTESDAFTAKDFRTWGATVRAFAYLASRPCDGRVSERAFNRCITATARHVAESLGNTPAVCRKSYINPAIFIAWSDRGIEPVAPGRAITPNRMERMALRVLRAQRASGVSTNGTARQRSERSGKRANGAD